MQQNFVLARGMPYGGEGCYYDEDEHENPIENKRDATTLYNRGLAFYYRGKFEQANYAFEEAVRLDPDDPNAWYNKGLVLSIQCRYPEAVNCFDRAIGLDPNNMIVNERKKAINKWREKK